jgi:hypothetical protein
MSSIVIAGDTSGSVTLDAPANAGATVLTLPTTSGTIATTESVTAFPAGTAMLFAQTSAPTGWTKLTSHDNKALRVVSGTASSGGSVAFTTAFSSQGVSGTVGNTTLTTSQIPSHRHYVRGDFRGDSIGVRFGPNDSPAGTNMSPDGNPVNTTTYTGRLYGWDEGGGGSHNHSFSGTAINLAVQYVDVIIATKD